MSYYLGLRRNSNQKQSTGLDFPKPVEPVKPKPADNDNNPRPPKPDNDNYRDVKRAAKVLRIMRVLFKGSLHGRLFEIGWYTFLWLMENFPELNPRWNSSGWKLMMTCNGARPPTFGMSSVYSGSPPALACLQGGGIINNQPTALSRGLIRNNNYSIFSCDNQSLYRRDQNGVAYGPHMVIEPYPEPWPWNDPWRRPLDPKPTPRPIPWPLIPHKAPDPWTPPPPTDVKPPERPPRDRRYDFDFDGDRARRMAYSSGPARRAPPRTKEKERKFEGSRETTQRVFKALSKMKEAVTELDDFIDTFFDSLPEKIQKQLKGRKTPQSKMQHVYNNWQHFDGDKWIKEFLENYFEDKVMGRALKMSDRAAKARGATNTTSSRVWMRAGRVF